jgi:hypothetical protein
MDILNDDKDFVLTIDSQHNLVAYLSVSWQPGKGKEFGYKVIHKLDQEGILVIGDTKGHPNMDKKRIQRIMSQADCFISVLPYRPDNNSKTSNFMLEELFLAIEINLPIIILYDSRITIEIQNQSNNFIFTFPDNKKFEILKDRITWHSNFDFGIQKSEELEIIHFIDAISRIERPSNKIPPYSFLISRLQTDFTLPRLACMIAAEAATGIPCICIDSKNYSTNIDDTIERARLLIKNAQFIIAEISLTDDNVDIDNPSRAHEIGLATAYLKKIFLVAHNPRRNLYHGLVARQLIWWDNEATLLDDLKAFIYNERGEIGRHVYNYELKTLNDNILPIFSEPEFDSTPYKPWTPPISKNSTGFQSWIFALSIGLIAGCIAYLLSKISGYDQTLDLVAIFAGLITFFFSSDLNRKIHNNLIRISYLKWLIPLIAFVLLVLSLTYNYWSSKQVKEDKTKVKYGFNK